MSTNFPVWCCLCDDPFEHSKVPPTTFPITPCKECDERTRKEVERTMRRGRTWLCPHRCQRRCRCPQNCPDRCTYCETLTLEISLRLRGPHSLRAWALHAILKDRSSVGTRTLGELMVLFDEKHPLWRDVTITVPLIANNLYPVRPFWGNI